MKIALAKNKFEILILLLFVGAFFVWLPRGEVEKFVNGTCSNPPCALNSPYSREESVKKRGFPLIWIPHSETNTYKNNDAEYLYFVFDFFLPILIASPFFIMSSKKENRYQILAAFSIVVGIILIWYPRGSVSVKQDNCKGGICIQLALPFTYVTERGFPIKWNVAKTEGITVGEAANTKNYFYSLIDFSIPVIMTPAVIYGVNRKKK